MSGYKKTCPICDKVFYEHHRRAIYCGRQCYKKSRMGMVFSSEHKKKISLALKGRKLPKEVCLKMSKSRRGLTKGIHLSPKSEFKGGNKHPNWNGGVIKAEKYIYIYNPNHPKCNCAGYVAEHRLVIEKQIARYLQSEEVVHHINCNRSDNRIENLLLCKNKSEHSKYHLQKYFNQPIMVGGGVI